MQIPGVISRYVYTYITEIEEFTALIINNNTILNMLLVVTAVILLYRCTMLVLSHS